MVFQSYALYPHMSIYDNMAFGLKLRKMPKAKIDERVKEAARILNLENLQKKPRELSGGQRQRVALGRAIVREPAVFLMDEPLSNLDAKLRVQTRAEIARLHQRLKTTIVYVTHDQVEAMTMGDRIAVMNNGLLQQVGPPQELYEHPTNKFVAGFIGSPAMNFEIVDGDAGPGAHMRATCDVVEFLGNEELLHVRVGEHDLVAIVDASHRVKPGDVLDLHVPLEKIHLFDEDGRALA